MSKAAAAPASPTTEASVAPAPAAAAATSPTAEMRLALITRIVACDDVLTLRTLRAVLDEAADAGALVGDDDVIGRRPDGTPVRPREAVKRWDEAVTDVLAGNGMTGEEALTRLAEIRAQR